VSNEYVLVLSRVAKAYRAGVLGCAATVEVLRGLTLKVRAAELATLAGPRGSGKTTLLLCAAGMLRPDEGEIRWPALPVRPGRPPAGIAYAANRVPTYGFLSTRESMAYAATVRDLHDPGTAADVNELLGLVALREYAQTRIGVLAPAERARLLVALALVASPRLLLVDDIDGGPDAVGRAAFARCLARVAADGIGVLWAARAMGPVSDAQASYALADGRVRPASKPEPRPRARTSIELDVPAAASATARLAPRVQALERRGSYIRVPLDGGASAEEVLALCRDLSIPVLGSRVVREH
jgi:ABC-type multidrug transport system ATPase subunit